MEVYNIETKQTFGQASGRPYGCIGTVSQAGIAAGKVYFRDGGKNKFKVDLLHQYNAFPALYRRGN